MWTERGSGFIDMLGADLIRDLTISSSLFPAQRVDH